MKSKLSLLALAFLTACGGGGGSSPSAPSTPTPSVQISASATKVFTSDEVKITWTSSNSTTCVGQDAIPNATQPVGGSYTTTLQKSGLSKFTLSCSGAGGSSTNSVIVNVLEPIQTFSGALSPTLITNSNWAGDYRNLVGEYFFDTWAWGIKSVSNAAFDIRGVVDVKNSSISWAEFNWDVTATSTSGVISYSSVLFGKFPGSKNPTTSSKFPTKIESMPSIRATGNIQTTCITACKFGTIFDLAVMPVLDSTPSDVGVEIIVIAQDSLGKINPTHPKYVGDAVLSGKQYKVYYNSFSSLPWNNIVYSPVEQSQIIDLDIRDVMKDAVNRGYIKSSDYILGVQLGTETLSGKGRTYLSNFKVN